MTWNAAPLARSGSSTWSYCRLLNSGPSAEIATITGRRASRFLKPWHTSMIPSRRYAPLPCSGQSRSTPFCRLVRLVVDGAIRDLEGINPIDMGVYIRGVHPTPLRNIVLTGYNIPIRIGGATVMPGDVIFGDSEGIYFIPPQFVEEILKRADVTHVHDEWTKDKFITGKYKSTDLYPTPADQKMKDEYNEYLKKKLGKQ